MSLNLRSHRCAQFLHRLKHKLRSAAGPHFCLKRMMFRKANSREMRLNNGYKHGQTGGTSSKDSTSLMMCWVCGIPMRRGKGGGGTHCPSSVYRQSQMLTVWLWQLIIASNPKNISFSAGFYYNKLIKLPNNFLSNNICLPLDPWRRAPAKHKEWDLFLCVGELFSCAHIYAANDWPGGLL